MSRSGMEHQLTQHRNGIGSLHELVSGVDGKVDGRPAQFAAHELRLATIDGRVDDVSSNVREVLRRLPAPA